MAGFYMKVPLPDGSYTDGKIDYTGVPEQLSLGSINFDNLRVLDVATNDGYWAFWAEQQGAHDVLAIDVDGFEGYDWGKTELDKELIAQVSKSEARALNWQGGKGFWEIHAAWNSKVRRETLSVYELLPETQGTYDVAFCYGLLYHLRHPLKALDAISSVCTEALILETHIVQVNQDVPLSLFYWDDAFRGQTNWTGPTEAACISWLKSAGFSHILAHRPRPNIKNGRETFVALKSDRWCSPPASSSAPRHRLFPIFPRRKFRRITTGSSAGESWKVAGRDHPAS